MLRAPGACKGSGVLGKQDSSTAPTRGAAASITPPENNELRPLCDFCVIAVRGPFILFLLTAREPALSVMGFSSYCVAVLYIPLTSLGTTSSLSLPQCQPHYRLPSCKAKAPRKVRYLLFPTSTPFLNTPSF